MIQKVVRQVSLTQSEEQSISDWALLSPLQSLEIGYQLRLQYLFAYKLSDSVNKSAVVIKKLGQEI